jgi:hypothetical protein
MRSLYHNAVAWYIGKNSGFPGEKIAGRMEAITMALIGQILDDRLPMPEENGRIHH